MEVEKRLEDTVFFEELINYERDISSPSDSILANKDLRYLLKNTPYNRETLDKGGVVPATVSNVTTAPTCAIDTILAENSKADFDIIIVVPREGNLRMFNAAEFIANGRWVDPDSRHNDVSHANKDRCDIVLPTSGHKLKVFITDSPATILSQRNQQGNMIPTKGWKMCVAVFTTGEDNQFTNWPFASQAKLFQHMKPFYLNRDGMKPPAQVKRTNSVTLNVSRQQRHFDAVSHRQFMKELEAFLLQPVRAPHCVSTSEKL